MKAAAFEHHRAASLADAVRMLAGTEEARVLAGGQSLGPMLNLRLASPSRLVSVGRLIELGAVEDAADAVTLGACVTHAAIAEGRTPDVADRTGRGILARVAQGIAYQAVRNRGTVGGSLCHADPAADWLCTLTALGGAVLTEGPRTSQNELGRRMVALRQFVTGAFRTALLPGEMVQAVRVPRPGADAGWGYVKACRKPGEFAHAMAAVLDDPAHGTRRAVIGAVGGAPLVLEGEDMAEQAAEQALAASGLDAIGRHMQVVVLRRAMDMARGKPAWARGAQA